MKVLQSSIFRALVALAVGALLIKYPDNTATGIVITIGVLFLLSGLVSVLTYFHALRHQTDYQLYDAAGNLVSPQKPSFPVVGIGSFLLGVVLAAIPATFMAVMTYIVGVVVMLGAITQYLNLIAARQFARLPLWAWLFPSLTLIMSFWLMFFPMETVQATMALLGWLTVFYGVTEMANSLRIFTNKRRFMQAAKEAQESEAEEISSEPHEPEQ